MSWDIALSPAGDVIFTPGDLVFSASADLSAVSGVDLVQQRIMLRLKVARGSWVYDEDGNFGSYLHSLTNMVPQQAQVQAGAYVREALRDMDEIEVDDVSVGMNGTALSIVISYHIVDVVPSLNDINRQQLELAIAGGPA